MSVKLCHLPREEAIVCVADGRRYRREIGYPISEADALEVAAANRHLAKQEVLLGMAERARSADRRARLRAEAEGAFMRAVATLFPDLDANRRDRD